MRAPIAALIALCSSLAAAAADPPRRADLTASIGEVAAGKLAPETFSLRLDWLREGHMTSAEVFGRGVGVWNRTRQVALAREQVLGLARALRDARFGTMPEAFGEKDPEGVVRIQGKLLARVGTHQKTVVQMLEGDRSRELAQLAARIFEAVEPASRAGVTASGVEDALGKLAAGTLAPETFELLVQRRPETTSPRDVAEGGFLLRVNGRDALARPFQQDGGYGTPRRLALSDAELASLVQDLRQASTGRLPRNLYAPQYTDVRVSVLGQEADLSARRWLNVTATTHGERQKAFDRLYQALKTLADRVLRSGTPSSE